MILRNKIFIGYFILMAVITSMAAILVHERERIREIEAESAEIRQVLRDINTAHRRITQLVTLGESVIGWKESDSTRYRVLRLRTDSLLQALKPHCRDYVRPAQIDTLRTLLVEKEAHLLHLMEVMEQQGAADSLLVNHLPEVARRATRVRTVKQKKKGIAGVLGGKKTVQILPSAKELHQFSDSLIALQQRQTAAMDAYADSLRNRNRALNRELNRLVSNLDIQAQYNLGKAKELITPVDSTTNDTNYTYPAKAVLNIRTEGNRHTFEEGSINADFYRHTYIDSAQTNDYYNNKILDISALFVMNEHPKYKYLPGLYAGLEFKRQKYERRVDYDTVSRGSIYGSDVYTGTYLTAGIFNVDTNASLTYDVRGQLGVLGYYAGNFDIDGYISQALNRERTTFLRADASIRLQSPNPFLNHYVGTHDQWDNDFKAVKTINLEGRYINHRLRTEIGVGFSNVFSHIYFDSTVMPRQSGKALIVLTAWAKETFRAGHFYFDQNVYFQKSTQEDILSLPAISVYSHNYYQNYLFKNALQLQGGIDIFYNTAFYADNYMPSVMQFYNQRKLKTGNYPKVDVFLNLHIKRAQLFVKYEHVNFHIKQRGDFFSAADYPINPAMFKFGVQWDFFD